MNSDDRTQVLLEQVLAETQAIREYVEVIPIMQTDIAQLKDDVAELKSDMKVIKHVVKEHSDDIHKLKSQAHTH